MWYLAVVFIFDIFLIVIFRARFCKLLARLRPSHRKASLVPILWTADIFASFLVRLIYPVDRIFTPLNLLPAFLPQYILAYTWGRASAYLNDCFIFAPFAALARPSTDLVWSLCISMTGLVALFRVSVRSSRMVPASIEHAMGGLNRRAFLYAVWNEVSFALIVPALMRVVAKHSNYAIKASVPGLRGLKSRVVLARYSYAALLLSTLAGLGVEVVIEALNACFSQRPHRAMRMFGGPVLMTASVGVMNVLLSWFLGWAVVEYVPGARRII